MKKSNLIVNGLDTNWKFPSTRYRGSKRKILGWIWENISPLEFNSALDLFSGTSVVSLLFKYMGKRVISNDYLKFNYETSTALIENNNIRVSDEDLDFVLNHISNSARVSFISDTFKGIYYTDIENQWLDNCIANIVELKNNCSEREFRMKKAVLLWALGQSCLIKRPFNLFHRKNLYLRTNNVARKFGNKSTWETPFPIALSHYVDEANAIIFDNGQTNSSLNLDVLESDFPECDLVYLDPPYFFDNQKDWDYRNIYHFLEGIVQYQKWDRIIDLSTKNNRLKPNGSNWPHNSKEKLEEIFKGLISKINAKIVVFSHKGGSLVGVQDIEKAISDTGREVYSVSSDYTYALSKRNGHPTHNVEHLIIGV